MKLKLVKMIKNVVKSLELLGDRLEVCVSVLNGIYVLCFQVFPFKPNMVLLMLHLIHIKF